MCAMIPTFLVRDKSAPEAEVPGLFSVLLHNVDDRDLLKVSEDLCSLRRHV